MKVGEIIPGRAHVLEEDGPNGEARFFVLIDGERDGEIVVCEHWWLGHCDRIIRPGRYCRRLRRGFKSREAAQRAADEFNDER